MKRFLEFSKLANDFLVFRNGLGHQIPETFGMIEFFEMAKFVHNNIVSMALWQKHDFVVEIQIALRTAAAPAGFLIANRHAVIFKSIKFAIFFQASSHKIPGIFPKTQILIPIVTRKQTFAADFFHSFHFVQNPLGILLDKFFRVPHAHAPWQSYHAVSIARNGNFEPFGFSVLTHRIFNSLVFESYFFSNGHILTKINYIVWCKKIHAIVWSKYYTF